MSLKTAAAIATGLTLLVASPSLAFSGQTAPSASGQGAPTDPDKAHSNMFRDLVASTVRTGSAQSHGSMVTYDVSQKASKAKAPESRDLIAADPRNPRLNPFLGQ